MPLFPVIMALVLGLATALMVTTSASAQTADPTAPTTLTTAPADPTAPPPDEGGPPATDQAGEAPPPGQPGDAQAGEQQRIRAQQEAQRRAQQWARRRAARQKELDALQRNIGARYEELQRARTELATMESDLDATVEEYNARMLELAEARRQAALAREELEAAQTEFEAAYGLLCDRLVGAYKSDNSALAVLVGSTSMDDFIRRLTLIVSLARGDRARVDDITGMRMRVERSLDDLSLRLHEVAVATEALEGKKVEIEGKITVRRDYVAGLDREMRGLIDRMNTITRQMVPPSLDIAAYLAVWKAGGGEAGGLPIASVALRYLGVPYVWGGETPDSGLDCSGLTRWVFLQFGISIPHLASAQQQLGSRVSLDRARPGDLVFFGRPAHHVAIYLGEGLIIEAPNTGSAVRIFPLAAKRGLSDVRRISLPG